ncbi:AbgT family transporter [uncultured Vagococcus sp.]|uniref:YfcC family protein n=1 Tax=uncultured Vagococcus sp. TaxID=189676 RepID=UPI0028D5A950|nr:AbgT family transporter [uncultured Vagococcus sp.]
MNEKETKGFKTPSPFILLAVFLLIAAAMTYLIPAGTFERVEVEGLSRPVVVPDTYQQIKGTPTAIGDLLAAVPQGMVDSGMIIFLVFVSAGSFNVFTKTGAFESGIGVAIKKIQEKHFPKWLVIWLFTFLFSLFGFVSGPDGLIPFTLVSVSVALGLGYDLIMGLALVLAGSGIGFAMSPINGAVVATPQSVVGLPIFSGADFRTVMWFIATCIMALMLSLYARQIEKDPKKSPAYGIETKGLELTKEIKDYRINRRQVLVLLVFLAMSVLTVVGALKFDWFLIEIAGLFLLGGIVGGLVYGVKLEDIFKGFVEGGSTTASVMLLIGFARGIQVLLERGNVLDTIINVLSKPLANFNPVAAGILISVITAFIHIFITSGSGLAVAMMPILGPIGLVAGLSMQTTILSFQMGGSILNMITPTLGSTMAMCGLARVPFDKWFKIGVKLAIPIMLFAWVAIMVAHLIGYQ